MAAERRKQYIAGGAVILAVAAVILAVFSLLSRTDDKDLYLADSQDQRCGWRYEVLLDGRVQDYEPVFASEYQLTLPEGIEAVRTSRVMAEEVPEAMLEWMSYEDGVEVLLDGTVLYSDFPGLTRDADGFVHPDAEQWDRLARLQGDHWRQARLSLPPDYLGRQLTMITYFPEDGEVLVPEWPFLVNSDSAVAGAVVFSVRYNAVMTIYALLALTMAGMYLLDLHSGHADGRTLLLCLYFLMLFLNGACGSDAGYYSGLDSFPALGALRRSYMAPLYLYLALRLAGRWRWPLCAGVAVWTAYELIQGYLQASRDMAGVAGRIGPGALIVFLAMAAVACAQIVDRARRDPAQKSRVIRYGLITAAVAAAYLLDRFRVWGGIGRYFTAGIWTALQAGSYEPVVTPVTDIASYVTVIVVIVEVVRRTVDANRTVDVLRERSRLTLEGYERTLRAEEATNAAKHEMRHHMTALSGLLQDGDTARAKEYIASVTDALDRLPAMRYCPNILVNAVAGSYLDQAKAMGVRVECSLKVPAELNVADEDMSVFLTNMLENALHACRRVSPERERYIRLKMALHENFLFIGCTNSAPDEQEAEELTGEERARRRHGYGLEAMRRIAEKYNSMLLMEHGDGSFTVKSNFSLRRATAAPYAGPRGR